MILLQKVTEVAASSLDSYLLAGVMTVVMAIFGAVVRASINKIANDRDEKEKKRDESIAELQRLVIELEGKTRENTLTDSFTQKEFESYKAMRGQKDAELGEAIKSINSSFLELGGKMSAMASDMRLVMDKLNIKQDYA